MLFAKYPITTMPKITPRTTLYVSEFNSRGLHVAYSKHSGKRLRPWEQTRLDRHRALCHLCERITHLAQIGFSVPVENRRYDSLKKGGRTQAYMRRTENLCELSSGFLFVSPYPNNPIPGQALSRNHRIDQDCSVSNVGARKPGSRYQNSSSLNVPSRRSTFGGMGLS